LLEVVAQALALVELVELVLEVTGLLQEHLAVELVPNQF
jgi:hypothetical protein